MLKPVIVVLSRDQLMASELPGLFQGRAEIRACDSLEELIDLAQHRVPDALVADFRRTSSGGHQETRILETVLQRMPKMRLAMVTPEVCPETLERCAAMTEITHLRGHLDRAALLKAFHSLFPDESPSTPTASQAPAFSGGMVTPMHSESFDEQPLGVLTGISRRYETDSPQLKQMLLDLEVAARHDVTILLIGETGAGKTYLSRLIHEVSLRRHEPFLPVACGALPNDLIESELFGHTKGSFTSAHQDKEGKFIAARRGSILLDEIDALGLEQQVKLLRVIETGEFEAVGSNHTLHCQARLIVASNLDLQPLVERDVGRQAVDGLGLVAHAVGHGQALREFDRNLRAGSEFFLEIAFPVAVQVFGYFELVDQQHQDLHRDPVGVQKIVSHGLRTSASGNFFASLLGLEGAEVAVFEGCIARVRGR